MNAQDQADAIFEAAVHSDLLYCELDSQPARRKWNRVQAADRKAGAPEARIRRSWVIRGGLAAALKGQIDRLVEERLAADTQWSWDDQPLDLQVGVLRELFRSAGLWDRFGWDQRHAFPMLLTLPVV